MTRNVFHYVMYFTGKRCVCALAGGVTVQSNRVWKTQVCNPSGGYRGEPVQEQEPGSPRKTLSAANLSTADRKKNQWRWQPQDLSTERQVCGWKIKSSMEMIFCLTKCHLPGHHKAPQCFHAAAPLINTEKHHTLFGDLSHNLKVASNLKIRPMWW